MGNKLNCNSQQIQQQRSRLYRAKAAGLIWRIYFSLTPWSRQEMSRDLEQQPEQSDKSAVFSVSWREKLEEVFRGGSYSRLLSPFHLQVPLCLPGPSAGVLVPLRTSSSSSSRDIHLDGMLPSDAPALQPGVRGPRGPRGPPSRAGS